MIFQRLPSLDRPSRLVQLLALLSLAGYFLLAHGCHAQDADTELLFVNGESSSAVAMPLTSP